MKKCIIIFLVFLSQFLQAQIDKNSQFISTKVFDNILFLHRTNYDDNKIENSYGTGFFVNYNNKGYLVTAKHFFDDYLKNEEFRNVEIFYNNKWKKFPCKIYIHENPNVDLAIVADGTSKNVGIPIATKPIITQEAFILGFPNTWKMDTPDLLQKPSPISKKGIISAVLNNSVDSVQMILLDIINNKGFSGGPLIIFDYEKSTWAVAGVIKGKVKNPNPKEIVFHEQGFSTCTPIHYLREIIDSIK